MTFFGKLKDLIVFDNDYDYGMGYGLGFCDGYGDGIGNKSNWHLAGCEILKGVTAVMELTPKAEKAWEKEPWG